MNGQEVSRTFIDGVWGIRRKQVEVSCARLQQCCATCQTNAGSGQSLDFVKKFSHLRINVSLELLSRSDAT